MRRRGRQVGDDPPFFAADGSVFDDAPETTANTPWSTHVGPYPVSCYVLDNPDADGDESVRDLARVECEHEWRRFDGNLQAPTIAQFLKFGLASAGVRLAAPMVKRYVTVEENEVFVTLTFTSLSLVCQLVHVTENVCLMGMCAFCSLRGFIENPRTGHTTPPSTMWWQLLFVALYLGAIARHANDCVLTHGGGVLAEQFIAFVVVNLIVAGWRPPLGEVVHSRIAGWALYSTAMHCFKAVSWYSHAIRFGCGVVFPTLLAAALEIRSRKMFASEIEMNIGAGVWGARRVGRGGGRRDNDGGGSGRESGSGYEFR